MARDFYSVLAVPRNATEEQIRQRFRELARLRHPDRFQGTEKEKAEREFQEITQAFNILADAERRRQHGVKAYKEKSWLEAADNFDRATKADPTNSQAWHHLALACAQERNWLPRAVTAIERACELEPMSPTYAKQAGRVCQMAGQADRAVHHYRRALQWGEDDPAVQRALDELTKAPRRGGLFGKA
jgi:curved DNA-binding protein CbpA